MKRFHFKPLAFKLLSVLIIVGAIFIIHSCKKDKSEQTKIISINDPAVIQAKRWYENTYPLNSTTNTKLATQSILTETGYDLSQVLKPDWQHPAKYSRFNDDVIEMPIEPGIDFGSDLKNATANKIYSDKRYSRSSFL